jgi:hypothetical protein
MHLVLPAGILDENHRSDKQGNIGLGSQTITGGKQWLMEREVKVVAARRSVGMLPSVNDGGS